MAEGLRRGGPDVGLECLVQPILQEQVRHADGQLVAGARELCFSREPEFVARLANALTKGLGKHSHDIILLKQGAIPPARRLCDGPQGSCAREGGSQGGTTQRSSARSGELGGHCSLRQPARQKAFARSIPCALFQRQLSISAPNESRAAERRQ